MDERKKQVLNAIIKDYIANAEPVGSRTITKRYDLGVSPATIRNEMSDLTEAGYIEQPHTSAGRIPSGKGYRYYVDNLMERECLSRRQVEQIRSALSGELGEFDSFMHTCCSMISQLTQYTSIASVTERGHGRIKNLQLVLLNSHQVLVILLASTGIIRHKIIELPESLSADELADVERGLYNALVGKDMSEISYDKLSALMRELQLHRRLTRQTMELLEHALLPEKGQRIFTGGVMNLLSQPEFHDIDRLKNIFSLLEQDDKIKKLIVDSMPDSGIVTVTIGGEMPVEGAQDCSMVVANYFVNGEKAGSIGVLGPTRMSYGRTVSLMEQIAAELSRVMSDKNK